MLGIEFTLVLTILPDLATKSTLKPNLASLPSVVPMIHDVRRDLHADVVQPAGTVGWCYDSEVVHGHQPENHGGPERFHEGFVVLSKMKRWVQDEGASVARMPDRYGAPT